LEQLIFDVVELDGVARDRGQVLDEVSPIITLNVPKS
jgi:hypothetical protein